MDIDEIRRTIDRCVLAVTARGVTIESGSYGVYFSFGEWNFEDLDKPTCCPLGAVIYTNHDVPVMEFADQEASFILGITTVDAWAFTRGFDGHPPTRYVPDANEFYRLGKSLRKRYIDGT